MYRFLCFRSILKFQWTILCFVCCLISSGAFDVRQTVSNWKPLGEAQSATWRRGLVRRSIRSHSCASEKIVTGTKAPVLQPRVRSILYSSCRSRFCRMGFSPRVFVRPYFYLIFYEFFIWRDIEGLNCFSCHFRFLNVAVLSTSDTAGIKSFLNIT